MELNALSKAILLATAASTLVACGSDDEAKEPNVGVVSTTRMLTDTAQCANGGIEIETGIDDNGNGQLDAGEVDNTQVVCNGLDGVDGQDSAPIISVGGVKLSQVGRYESGIWDDGGAEIVAFDSSTDKTFVVNAGDGTVDVLDLTDPSSPNKTATITLSDAGVAAFTVGGANSVAVSDGILAVAVENDDKQANGKVYFYNTDTLAFIAAKDAGALPDMVTFTPDGNTVLVANEGEPSKDYKNDPEGSITVIDISGGVAGATPATADFTAFNVGEVKAADLPADVRIFGPNASVAQDLEPEYIAVSADSATAFVALQENNGLAIVDIATATVTDIVALGFKDHSLAGNKIDANKNDKMPVLENIPVYGMYQPDSIASYTFNDQTFIVSANEGDGREYLTDDVHADEAACLADGGIKFEEDDGDLLCFYFLDEADLSDLALDTSVFSNDMIAKLQDGDGIGDLTVTNTLGDVDEDGVYDSIYAYGARSFSIWNAEGELVFDSGDQFERILAMLSPDYFNLSNDKNKQENRSDNKGPEPEGIAVGVVDGRTYAFIGLERQGGIMVYDISNPYSAAFVDYYNNRDFGIDLGDVDDGTLEPGAAGDLGPEGLAFVSAEDSPNGTPLLIVGSEVSGTTTVYEVK
jgi:WD40 repeat protein